MKKSVLTIFALALTGLSLSAQTTFWTDTFEASGQPTSGTRTPENNSGSGGPPQTAYFKQTDGTGIALQVTSGNYSVIEGTQFWAGENHLVGFGAGNEEQQIEWTGINISGRTSLVFTGAFAAHNSSAAWENTLYGNSHTDYIRIEYSIDGGGYTTLLQFMGNDAANKRLCNDVDLNGIGEGTQLSKAFQDFAKAIPGTGTTLALRIRMFSNDPAEEFGIDNFRVAATTLPFNELNLNALIYDQQIDLSWSGELASPVDHFTVKRSANGDLFTQLEQVDANGASSYSWTDFAPLGGTSYYLVTAYDQVGNEITTEGRWVTRADGSVGYSVTTLSNGQLETGITGDVAPGSVMTVVNSVGQVVHSFPVETAGAYQFDISDLNSGLYWVSLTGAERSRERVIVLK